MAYGDAKAIPIKTQPFRVTFPLYDADGDLVTSTGGLDSEVSLDSAAFADCSNETTEIAQGVYYLDLNSNEMNADTVAVVVKSDDAKTGVIIIYPDSLGFTGISDCVSDVISTLDGPIEDFLSDIYSDTTAGGAGGTATIENQTSILSDISSLRSNLSDIHSALSNSISDVLSTLDGPVLTEISDARSGILSAHSDINSQLTIISNAVSNVYSDTDDIYSNLAGPVEDMLSDIYSDTTAGGAGGTATIERQNSIISDISELRSNISALHSDIVSQISNVLSTLDGPIEDFLSDIYSDTTAGAAGGTATIENQNSLMSDISELRSNISHLHSALSDSVSDVLSTLDAGVPLADNAITSGAISDGALVNAKFAASCLTETEIVIDDTECADAADATLNFWERLKYFIRFGTGTNRSTHDGAHIKNYNDADDAVLAKHAVSESGGVQTRNKVID